MITSRCSGISHHQHNIFHKFVNLDRLSFYPQYPESRMVSFLSGCHLVVTEQRKRLKPAKIRGFQPLRNYSSSSLHKEICVIIVACALLLFGFIAHLDHDNLYRAQSVLKMYSRLFLVQTVSRLVSPICTHWLLCLNQSPY